MRTGPYSQAALLSHAEYVARGKCPAGDHKMWCNDNAGHSGDHWALSLTPSMKAHKVYWPNKPAETGQQKGPIK